MADCAHSPPPRSPSPSTSTLSCKPSSIDGFAPDVIYPAGKKLVSLVLTLCLVALSVGLNNTILTTAIPSIASSFSSLSDVGWYGSAFFLPETALQPVFGKLYTFFDVKRVYVAVLVIFQIGLFVCATSKTSTVFIVGRAVAGVGGAGLLTGGITIISHLTVREKRSGLMSAVMSLNIVSSSCGPIIGGALAGRFGWRWCFWAILLLSFAALVSMGLLFEPAYTHEREQLSLREKARRLDPVGCTLLVGSVLCLLLALHFGASNLPWSDRRIVIPLVLSFVLLVSFVVTQRFFTSADVATVPSEIISRRGVWASCGLGFSLNMGANNHLFFLPYYFQVVHSLDPQSSGVRTVPYFVGITFCAGLSGILHTKVGYYNPFMLFGSCLFLVGSCLLHTLRVNTAQAAWIGYEALSGCGIGLSTILTVVAVHTILPEPDHQVGTAVVIMFQLLGGAVSASVSNTVFVKQLLANLNRVPEMTTAEIAAVTADPLGVRDFVRGKQIGGVLEAFVRSLGDTFYIAIGAAACAIVFACLQEWAPVIRATSQEREDEKA